MAEKKYVGVINSRNRTRVIEVEEGSTTHKKASLGIGGWSLADATQMAVAEKEKKSAESAVDKTAAPEPTPEPETPQGQDGEDQNEAATGEGEPKAEQESAPAPKKGGRPKKSIK